VSTQLLELLLETSFSRCLRKTLADERRGNKPFTWSHA
ncbi:uncharacterized protein METZ01_LOCUS393137, partial [marine metagenome]